MALRVQLPAGARPWVDQVARYIPDPVARLRFLKTVAPGLPDPEPRLSDADSRRRWYFPLMLLIVVLVTATVLSFSLLRGSARAPLRPDPSLGAPSKIMAGPPKSLPDVWPVERSAESETYSNGLRIETGFAVGTHGRSFLAFPAAPTQRAQRRSAPVGIVFHTTESLQAPFEARENGVLKRIGESTLDFVRRRRSYNFVIDRFGRVYRIVPEDQAANHAGHSLWSDEHWIYVNLNESFLGVSFEAETRHPDITPAQVRSAGMLIEMLRSRYHIPPENCVTHAQVSVNPANLRVGYHVDWAAGFPFAPLGLPDNYPVALPSLWQFGFASDESFRGVAGVGLKMGIGNAEYRLAEAAHAIRKTPDEYRRLLHQDYRRLLAEVRRAGVRESVEPE